MKIYFTPLDTRLSNLYKTFSQSVKSDISKKKTINPKNYSCKLHDIGRVFEQENKTSDLNRMTARLAEYLVSTKCDGLAGITYSFLIKLNKDNPKIVEEMATKALAIAKRQHDPVHIMARANDLKRIYKITEPGSDKHIKILYEIKRALTTICTNYESTRNRYRSVSTKMKPRQQYEIMLASIKIEIGRALKVNNPKLAKEELLSSREFFLKVNYPDKLEEIDKLLKYLQAYK